MAHRRQDLGEGDIALLATPLGTTGEALRAELDRRPKYLDDVLAHPDVAETVLHGTDTTALTDLPDALLRRARAPRRRRAGRQRLGQ